MKQLGSLISPRSLRVFNAWLLSLLMLTAPLVPLASTPSRTMPVARTSSQSSSQAKENSQVPGKQKIDSSLLKRFLLLTPPVGPNVTATLKDAFIDNNASGKADPGSIVTYTAVISNATGTADAANVVFTDTPDPNTTLVGGSIKVSPLALNDSYNTANNTALIQPAAGGVLANDTGTPAPTAVPIVAGPTTGGGTVTLNANGSFTYTPMTGFTGPDTFTYTATNGQASPSPSDATATVTITVAPPNTPPVANNDTASATEAGGTANGTAGTNPSGNLVTGVGPGSVADTDAEDPSSALVVVAVHTGPEGGSTGTGTVGSPLAGLYGSLTLNSNGSYTYTVDNNNATVQALRTSGDTIQDIFNYTIQDTGGAQDTAQFTVTIAGANDAPTDIASSSTTVPENQPINTVVGNLSTTDVDAGDTFTYTLVSGTGSTDNASFNINGAQLRTSASFDFETKSSYSIRLRTTDAGGLFFEKVFTITVTNVNEAPTDIALSQNTIGENMPINTVVGNFSTTDPDAGDTFTYTLVAGAGSTDNASFNINGNQLRTSAIFDFETKSSYSIRVRSTDAGSLFFEKQFTITIVNNNDTPTDIALSNSSVAENQPINTVVGNFSTTDQDAGNTFTYTLVAGAGSTDNASFNINGAQLRTSASFDFETKNSYSIRVRTTDNSAAFFEKQFTINVTDVPEAPVLTTSGGSASFTEDGLAVAVDPGITVADQDSPTLASGTVQITGNLQSGEDVLAFTNNGSTMGNIAAAAYIPGTGVLSLTSSGSTATLAQWQNALRAVTYNNTSQNPSTLARTISFTVNDGALNSNIATKGVTVTAVNDAPVLANIEGGALAYTENDAATAVSSTITVTDVDSANLTGATVQITGNYQSGQDVLSFVTQNGISGSYNSSNGTMTLSGSSSVANYQTALRAVKYNNSSDDPSTLARTVTFQVNDGGAVNNLSNTQTRNINITAVNDPPTANGFTNLPAQAGIPISYPVGKLGGTDVEAGTTVTVKTTPTTVCAGCLLTLNADGSFVFTPPPSAAGTTVSFTYKVTDNGNPPPGVDSTAAATVSFVVAGPAIYFVKQAGVGNCTLLNECTLFTALASIGAATNTRIFIEDNGAYTDSVTLNSNGWLIGQGVIAANFDTLFGILTPGQGTLATRPLLGQPPPTITVSTAGVNVVNLNGAGTTNSVRGLNLTTGSATTKGISGTSFGTLTTSETVISGSGPGIDLSTGSLSGSFTSITSTGGANNIRLNAINGSSTLGSGALSNASGDGFLVTGGAATLTYSGTIASGLARSVNISGMTAGGNVTLSGAITDTDTGISLTSNTGATINLSGTLTLSTTPTNTAFNATGGGTVNATATDGHVSYIKVTNVGSGYTSAPTVTFSSGTGSATAVVANGKVVAVNVTGVGNYVTPPTIGFTGGGGSGATATALLGAVSTITTTTGTAVNVSGTTIGSGSLNFKSITAGTGAGGPANAIVLSNTGASGGLVVTGDGAASNNGSGGTIQKTTGVGISLTSTQNVHLGHINLLTSGDDGINGHDVTNFTLDRCNLTSNGNATAENGLQFGEPSGSILGVAGTVAITNTAISQSAGNNVHIRNASNGTLASFVVTGSSFNNTVIATGANSFLFEVTDTATVTSATLTSCTVQQNTPLRGLEVQAHLTGTITKFTVQTSTFINNGIQASFTQDGSANIDFNFLNNGTVGTPITGSILQALNVFSSSTATGGTLKGRIEGNFIGNPGVAGSGSTQGQGIKVVVQGKTVGTFNIDGNTVRQVGQTSGSAGIVLDFDGAVAGGLGITQSDVTLTNNTVQTDAPNATFPLAAIFLRADDQGSPARLRADVRGNTVPLTGSWDYPTFDGINGAQLVFVENVATAEGQLVDNPPGSATAQAELQSHNTGLMYADNPGVSLIAGPITTPPAAMYKPERPGQQYYLARTNQPAQSTTQGVPAVKSVAPSTDSAIARGNNAARATTQRVAQPIAVRSTTPEAVKIAKAQAQARPTASRTLAHHASGKATPLVRGAASKASVLTPFAPPPPGVNVNIGTLPQGKSVAITFQVTLNTAMPFGTNQVSTQGRVDFTGGPVNGVLTDDPDTGPPLDATVTPVDAPTATTSSVSGQILDGNGNPVEGAAIRMNGTQNRLTITDALGNYHFDNVETNGVYTVTPSRANYGFSPTQRSFSQLGNHTDAVFTASYGGGTANPLDTTEYFVRQQYVDFLGREPDESGFNFWVNNIEGCGADSNCRAARRTQTSAAFFLSIEFQQTGYLVYRMYQSAYGDIPGAPVPVRLGEFKPDTQEIGNGVVVLQTGWEAKLDNNKQTFAEGFVQRPRFTSVYGTTMTPADFVDKLFQTAGVTPADSDRTAAINEFGGAGTIADVAARGRALRRVAENSLLARQEFNQAFVLMQYFGYLRRNPYDAPEQTLDYTGYNYWLNKLDTFNGNYEQADMVKAFVVSLEYRQRFPK